jgi:uncharacterized membrane protein YbaN (DUF454 family)
MRQWAKKSLIGIGFLALGLGIVGIFVPLLPTTPFLLLAAACFVRSSNRLYHWLIGHRMFGNYIRCYREYHAISLRAKIFVLSLLWGTLGYSAIFAVDSLWIRIALGCIGIGVTIHLVIMRTLTKEMVKEEEL